MVWMASWCRYYAGGHALWVCVCACVFNHDARPLSVLQPFTGISTQAKSQLGSPEEQLSTIMYPPSSVLNHQEKNSSVLSVLGFGMKAGIFWPTEQPQNHTAKYTGARADIETWLIMLSCLKKKKLELMTKRAIQALTSHSCKTILENLDNIEFQSLTALSRAVQIFHYWWSHLELKGTSKLWRSQQFRLERMRGQLWVGESRVASGCGHDSKSWPGWYRHHSLQCLLCGNSHVLCAFLYLCYLSSNLFFFVFPEVV